MKERPILFSGPMVRAILEWRKTQTRRIVKQVPHWQHCGKDIMEWGLSGCYTNDEGRHWLDIQTEVDDNSHEEIRCPYGQPGDRLWVRETWAPHADIPHAAIYRCDRGGDYQDTVTPNFRWRPSIHMPRWASRITLEIVSVRVERLQDISERDAKAEGLDFVSDGGARHGIKGLPSSWSDNPIESYRALWESINSNRPTLPANKKSRRYKRVSRWLEKNPPVNSWDANPWVWVIEFKRADNQLSKGESFVTR